MTIEVLFLSEDSNSLGNLVKYKKHPVPYWGSMESYSTSLMSRLFIVMVIIRLRVANNGGILIECKCNKNSLYLRKSQKGSLSHYLPQGCSLIKHFALTWPRLPACAETCTSQQHVGYIQYNIELLNREKGISSTLTEPSCFRDKRWHFKRINKSRPTFTNFSILEPRDDKSTLAENIGWAGKLHYHFLTEI